MVRVWLALGSNLAKLLQVGKVTLLALSGFPKTRLVACSSYYRNRPLSLQDQPDFLNAVVALETALSPESLLDYTQTIELCQGRTRKAHRFELCTLI
ncbi:2-amino-4-hydroxy-6-hydroxymethyldihydropteridine diphosphokinase [Candidatus Doolittlea endobia]|uniref:2-amino-4-hydroxy-6- hydroxymethyldihydropteridine diphosphokinase n=1 Tax=Candidatus Doolittlea endobia TaxID=1778262 RepID=UPI000A51688E|nr:2-amino-4-hydroxy-6-hydroxymethyldihydropteridine diphosphokinase [Candidatus Doolittlea endobia]